MFKLKIIASFVLFSFFLTNLSLAAVGDDFKVNNPDGQKYEFARSYISALGYFHKIEQRWAKRSPGKLFKGDDAKIIRTTIEYLVQDNTELRIAKNYILKYLTFPNPLMRKVADMMIVVCENDIVLNNDAKVLWQGWLGLKNSGKADAQQEAVFIKFQREIESKRKENDKKLIEASVLMTKVLLSQKNKDDKGHMLAITERERSRLLAYLDTYGKGVLDWGLKPGQSTLQASVAVIREVLEDSIYTVRM